MNSLHHLQKNQVNRYSHETSLNLESLDDARERKIRKETLDTYFASWSQSFHHDSYMQYTLPTCFLQKEQLVSVLSDITTAALSPLESFIPFLTHYPFTI